MRFFHSIRDLHSDINSLFDPEGPPRNSLLQRFPFQELHDNKGLSSLFAEIENGADVGMIQCGDCAGLSMKPFQGSRVLDQIFREKFYSDEPV